MADVAAAKRYAQAAFGIARDSGTLATWRAELADVAAVLVTATARMMTNPGQIARDSTAGPFSESIRGGFVGWSLAETFVLNRYRKRSL